MAAQKRSHPIEKMPGCIFDYFGRIPESVYTAPDQFDSPLEEAVFSNDVRKFRHLVQEGHRVGVWLKIGQMSCIEYAAMKGYCDILAELISCSVSAQHLRQYFALDDIVERAYLISRNKSVFFDGEALAEANRYVAALYTAIAYDQPRCVELVLSVIGRRDATRHSFCTDSTTADPAHRGPVKSLGAGELARSLGHTECLKVFAQWQQQATAPVCT